MNVEYIKDIALKKGYELILSQDEKRYGLIPISDPHCAWEWFDSLEKTFDYLKNHNTSLAIIKEDKIHYYFNNEPYSLKNAADHLNDIGITALVFGAKKGEHKCLVLCKDKNINLEKIVLNIGRKKMGFSKMVLPFRSQWEGYYVGGFVK